MARLAGKRQRYQALMVNTHPRVTGTTRYG